MQGGQKISTIPEKVFFSNLLSSMFHVHAHKSLQKSASHHSRTCCTHPGPTPGANFPQVINTLCERMLLDL